MLFIYLFLCKKWYQLDKKNADRRKLRIWLPQHVDISDHKKDCLSLQMIIVSGVIL